MATKRGYYRAELLRAINNLEMALTHVVRLIDDYENHHPEIAEALRAIADAIVAVGEAIQDIHDRI